MIKDDLNRSEEDNRHVVVDPSEAVTGVGFVLGIVGGAAGVLAAIVVSPQFAFSTFGYCGIGALAGGSAGVVTGGMIGAMFSVARGRLR
ncbi:hypothetical protein [Shinella zoogloeoides]